VITLPIPRQPGRSEPFAALPQAWIAAVVRQPLSGGELRLALAVASRLYSFWADDGGPQAMTYSELATDTGMHRSRVVAAMAGLVRAGLVTKSSWGGRLPNVIGLRIGESANSRALRTVNRPVLRTVEQSTFADPHTRSNHSASTNGTTGRANSRPPRIPTHLVPAGRPDDGDEGPLFEILWVEDVQ